MRKLIWTVALLSAFSFGQAAAARAESYKVDTDHTGVTFAVRHLFTKVNGRFDKFDGTISFDPKAPEKTTVEGSIDAASINTNVDKRDAHLRSKDFFDIATYPKITFKSTKVTDLDAAKQHGKLHGLLKIRDVEKPVVLDVTFLGAGKDPWGNVKAGFTARTTINRKDFGLNWNETLETGGLLVGDEVEVDISAEGNAGE